MPLSSWIRFARLRSLSSPSPESPLEAQATEAWLPGTDVTLWVLESVAWPPGRGRPGVPSARPKSQQTQRSPSPCNAHSDRNCFLSPLFRDVIFFFFFTKLAQGLLDPNALTQTFGVLVRMQVWVQQDGVGPRVLPL